tara:strand:+ start:2953 stop:3330 length:378 start_codon:yes stop_codon:yes gene_type:complete
MTDQLLNNGFPLDTFYPPNETVDAWAVKYEGHMPHWVLRHLAAEAAKWGADQELEACIEWLDKGLMTPYVAIRLRSDRRPNSPSLKEQAKFAAAVLRSPDETCSIAELQQHWHTICKALEELPND